MARPFLAAAAAGTPSAASEPAAPWEEVAGPGEEGGAGAGALEEGRAESCELQRDGSATPPRRVLAALAEELRRLGIQQGRGGAAGGR